MQANILPFYSPLTPGWDQKVKTIFSRLQGKKFRKMFYLMLNKNIRLGKKVTHWNYADKYIFIEHSDLIGFGYDLSDTQDGLPS